MKKLSEHGLKFFTIGLDFNINIGACPLGSDLSETEHKCVCDKYLQLFTPYSKNNNDTVVLHRFCCPFDYCKNESVNVIFSNVYMQCDFNRNGTLCGKCQKNFSLAFGSMHCVLCNNDSTALILLFAVINPLRMRRRVTVVCLCVCLSVTALAAPVLTSTIQPP